MGKEPSGSNSATSGASAGQTAEIRPFPYPYKAALAISNDLDAIRSFNEMKAIHDVLNGRKMTPCGPGLGLEIGDSFHFYSVHPEQDDTLSYFKGTSNKLTEDAPALREGIISGLLDTLHTWGNFSQKGGFLRKHARRALEELNRYDLKIPIWTNHGDIHNFQNLGRSDSLGDLPEKASRHGDRSTVLEYHLDLTVQAGVRYIWIKELTPVPGQERPLESRDWLEEGTSLGRDLLKGFYNRYRDSKTKQPLQMSNLLIRPTTFRDGTEAYEMLRFGSFHLDGSDNIPQLLTVKNLNRLIEVGGAILLYTHLGKGRPSLEKPFTDDAYRALSRLAQRSIDGDLWVTTPARLCRYVEMRQRLKLYLDIVDNTTVITGHFERLGDLKDPELSGLTFYLPDVKNYSLEVGSTKCKIIRNPSDHTGRISCSVPLAPLEYCWE